MSDKSEQMKPIPDGGLKEAMPSWLKRPPAWRDLPSVEERHERALPEPDTSTIDPHSLVDVSDLPQWLQLIAARGEVEQPQQEPAEAEEQTVAADVAETPEPADTEPEPVPAEPEQVVATEPTAPATPENATTGTPMWLMPVALLISLALLLVLVYVL